MLKSFSLLINFNFGGIASDVNASFELVNENLMYVQLCNWKIDDCIGIVVNRRNLA
jgi:hypothetical protein